MSCPWAERVRYWAGSGRSALTTDNGPELTYRRWVDQGEALARAFLGAGLRPGARVATPTEIAPRRRRALCSYNVPELRPVPESVFLLSASLKNDRSAPGELWPTVPSVL